MKILLSEQQTNKLIKNAMTQPKWLKDKAFIDEVKKTWNYDGLNQAIDWWNKWTMNSIVISKYSKNWKISDNETRRIMNLYREALKDLSIEYIYNPEHHAIAYVRSVNPKVVYVNSVYTGESNPVDIFIHELQHLLYFIKPLHPSQDIKKDINIDMGDPVSVINKSFLISSNKIFKDSKVSNIQDVYELKMEELGLNKMMKNYYRDLIKSSNPTSKKYTGEGTEIYSRLKVIKRLLNKSETEDIRINELGYLNNLTVPGKIPETNVVQATLSLLLSNYDINMVLNSWNKYATNNTTPTIQV